MRSFLRFAALLLVGVVVFLLLRHGRTALQPSRPPDVAADAQFAQSGYNLQTNEPTGNWVACAVDGVQNTDWCRITDARGHVVFQGDMMPLSGGAVLSSEQLAVATIDPDHLWTTGPAEGGAPVPIVPLRGGDVLVPAADRDALAARWREHPEELAALTTSGR